MTSYKQIDLNYNFDESLFETIYFKLDREDNLNITVSYSKKEAQLYALYG
jgi:hypothetical protein